MQAMNALFEGVTQLLGHRSFNESKLLKAVRLHSLFGGPCS